MVRVSARELDLVGARAWPSLEHSLIDGWQLRFAGGVMKWVNSVLPLGDNDQPMLGETDLAQRIEAVERAYAEHGLPARFQVTASTEPHELPDVLAEGGYVESDRTFVMTAPLAAGTAPLCVSLAHRRAVRAVPGMGRRVLGRSTGAAGQSSWTWQARSSLGLSLHESLFSAATRAESPVSGLVCSICPGSGSTAWRLCRAHADKAAHAASSITCSARRRRVAPSEHTWQSPR